MKPKASLFIGKLIRATALVLCLGTLVSCANNGHGYNNSRERSQHYQSGNAPYSYPQGVQPVYGQVSSQRRYAESAWQTANVKSAAGPQTSRMPQPQSAYMEVSTPRKGWHHAREIRVKSREYPKGYYFVKNHKGETFQMTSGPFWQWWSAQGGSRGPINVFDPFDPSLGDYRREPQLEWITKTW